MKIRSAFLIVSLTFLLLGRAGAALVWEQKEADLHPALTDKTANSSAPSSSLANVR